MRRELEMQDSEYKELVEYARRRGFSVTRNDNSTNHLTICFYPSETIGLEEHIYLAITPYFLLEKHKFLSTQAFRSLPSLKVTPTWVRKFLDFRSSEAKKDNDEVAKQINQNKAVAEENERNLPSGAEEELDRIRKIHENKPAPASGRKKHTSLDEYDDQGPLSDDWDQADWEQYMGGPDL